MRMAQQITWAAAHVALERRFEMRAQAREAPAQPTAVSHELPLVTVLPTAEAKDAPSLEASADVKSMARTPPRAEVAAAGSGDRHAPARAALPTGDPVAQPRSSAACESLLAGLTCVCQR